MGRAEVLLLAFRSLGVIYAGIGTSPLYVYPFSFANEIKDKNDILGVLSLMYYTLALLLLTKCVFIVFRANNNDKSSTFALYSPICSNVKVGFFQKRRIEDQQQSNDQLELPSLSSRFKKFLDNTIVSKNALIIVSMIPTSLVIGHVIPASSISVFYFAVLSALEGLKAASSSVFTEGMVGWLSVPVLILLFSVQHRWTDKIKYVSAPIVSIWFLTNARIGLYNFIKYDPTVIKALNPCNIIHYFTRNGKEAWISLAGVLLCVTGAKALLADISHFTVNSIQISTSVVVYSSLMLTYTGQASYLRLHQNDVANAFYASIPDPLYWPMFVIAVLAAITAIQAMITTSFSIIQQPFPVQCFPRLTVIHPSDKFDGQVYIPGVKYMIMMASIIVILAFRTTANIGVVIALYGYCTVAFASMLLTIIMLIWKYVYWKNNYYKVDNKVSHTTTREIIQYSNFCRFPGLAIFYSDLVLGIPVVYD